MEISLQNEKSRVALNVKHSCSQSSQLGEVCVYLETHVSFFPSMEQSDAFGTPQLHNI